MLILRGTLHNAYVTVSGTDNETGKAYGGKHKVQILSDDVLRNGETRSSLYDLTVKDSRLYASAKGKEIDVEVGVMVLNGSPHFYTVAEGKVFE